MLRKTMLVITSLIALNSFAQNKDSVKIISSNDTIVVPVKDTVRVGKLLIITKTHCSKNTIAKIDKSRPNKLISTNWWVFDLGFANVVDNTDYYIANAQSAYLDGAINGHITANSMALRAGKTSNVNIWIFMQKLNMYKHVFNLKYGLGLEMYNFRYEHSLSYRNDPYPYIFNDTVSFSKNKLYAGYLTVPLMINFKPIPSKSNSFSMSLGVSAGYLVGNHQKQISDARGKQKIRGDFDLNPWRFATIGEIGLGPVRLYGSYSLNNLYKKSTGLDQTPYAVGIRFSNW